MKKIPRKMHLDLTSNEIDNEQVKEFANEESNEDNVEFESDLNPQTAIEKLRITFKKIKKNRTTSESTKKFLRCRLNKIL